MRSLKSLVSDEAGNELVEFALAASLFFTMLFGIIAFCMLMFASSFLAFAAQQGTRYAMVRGSDWTSACASATSYGCQASTANVQNYILSLNHPGINLKASDITVTWLTTTASGSVCTQYSQGCQVKVKVSYTFGLNIPFIPATSIPLSSTSIETIQD